MIFYGGTNDTARVDLDSIKSNHRALETVVKVLGTQVVVSVLLRKGKDVRRKALTAHVNNWLQK